DRGDVAVGIVVVAVVQELGAAIGIQTAVGQAADVAGQGVDDAVAVGELLHRPVGVVADAGGVGARLGRLAQGVGGVGHRMRCAVGMHRLLAQVPVGVVGVVDGPVMAPGTPRQQLPLVDQQAAAVVGVAGGHDVVAAAVGCGDRGQLPGRGVGVVHVGLAVGELQRGDAVAGVVGP